MPKHLLPNALSRVVTWPAGARAKLAACAEAIEAGLAACAYHPTEAELAGIDRGLADARASRFAINEQVVAVFARHRVT